MITTIDPSTALVLIDLQKGVVKSDLAHPVQEVLGKAAALKQAFIQRGMPVIVVNVDPGGAPWTKTRKDPSSPPMPPLPADYSEIVPEIDRTKEDIYITKTTWNAFFDTSLHQKLQDNKITGIVLAGISTSAGVESTARSASELGYNISFATDAMTDKIAAAHNNSLQNIFPRLGELGTVQDIINKLR